MSWRERAHELREAVEDRTGLTVQPRERLELLEARSQELGATRRELDALAWTALDYVGNSPQELKAVERRKLVQKCRIVWMKDPQAGAAVDLMNDFVFGRGIPKPKANDEKVQDVIDEAWEDPDNRLVLTTYEAQTALGSDLSMQSNLFVLVFDDGEDGKVKLGLLDHDAVENVVRDPDNRLRIMYFVARHFRTEWDFEHDAPKQELYGRGPADAKKGDKGKGEIRYYEHWAHVEQAREEDGIGGSDDASVEDQTKLFEAERESEGKSGSKYAPSAKMGDGKVFHIAVNRTSEMAFGHPTMDRVLRWHAAYNSFVEARLDIIQAKAAFVMKKKVKGTPSQLQKQAQQAVSRRSALGAATGDPDMLAGPKPASVLLENQNVEHEDINLDTGAASAAQDGQMIRAQVSAATRFPQSYYGDAQNSNLATATSLELPVLKAVESRQELIEQLVRFFVDRVIERAQETGRLEKNLTPDEVQDKVDAHLEAALRKTWRPGMSQRQWLEEAHRIAEQFEPFKPATEPPAQQPQVPDEEAPQVPGMPPPDVPAIETERDLGYEFSMPNPLRRMVTDLVTSIQNIARTFDPNNTNPELSRVLLTIALGEGLEVDDAPKLVERIFPPGYVDPAIQAQQQMPLPTDPNAEQFGEFGPPGAGPGPDGQRHPNPANPYGAPMNSSPPGANYGMQQAADGDEPVRLDEVRLRHDAPRREGINQEFEEAFGGILPALNPKQGR